MQVHQPFDSYSFVKYIKYTGRAYQRQAIALVSICRVFVEVSPEGVQQDAQFKEAMFAVDLALRSATKAGKAITDVASNAFDKAQKKLLQYEKSVHPRVEIVTAKMTEAKQIDQRHLGLFNRLVARRGVDTTTRQKPKLEKVKFTLLESLTDEKPLVVYQMLSAQSEFPEILWNFSRLTDERRRIPLRQNPHFYHHLPTSREAYGAEFSMDSMKDFLLSNDTIYVLVDKPSLGRIYLEAQERKRIFGNVWMPKPNDVMIFKDIRGKLQGEQLVGNDIQSHQELFWRDELDISLMDSCAIPRELPKLPWKPVTDIQDWKVLIQEKTLHSTKTSVRICVSPVVTNDKAPLVPEKRASNQKSDAPPATIPTRAPTSVHGGALDANPEVPPIHGADSRCLLRTQVHPAPLTPGPPNQHTPGPKSITVNVLSPPPPTSPVPPAPAHLRGSPNAAIPHTMALSSPPRPVHYSKPPDIQGPRKNVPEPQVPTSPGPFSTSPPSKTIDDTLANPRPNLTSQRLHPQLASNNMQPRSLEQKPAPIQNRTMVNNPTQGPTKSTKSSISISSFTQMFKPLSMPGAFPGPQMDVDWVMVSPGPADVQGGNWLKRLFRRHG
ncbi:hypothetical protein H4582DRAFT_2075780 [Lactarius indigo]|nr:hypothetical protein H4582DRAFT_2075780 [Lactarius indigo]